MASKPTTTTPSPFASDAEYLGAEFEFLRVRTSRIEAEKSVEVARRQEESNDVHAHRPGRVPGREARCRALELDAEEKHLRAEIDAGLVAHRVDSSRPILGLDNLCIEHGLSPEERVVLLAAAVAGISQQVADASVGDLVSFYGAMTVSDHIELLDPKSVTDWLQYRRLFRRSSPLRRAGLIVLSDTRGIDGPETLLLREVRLSMHAFAVIVGDGDAVTEHEARVEVAL